MLCFGVPCFAGAIDDEEKRNQGSIRFLKQALVDRPDQERRVVNFKRLALTDFKIDVPRLAKKKVLSEAFTSAGSATRKLDACKCN